MKVRLLFILGAVIFSGLSEAGWGLENPAGLATVPPSTFRSSLVRSPNPIGVNGNLLITGNVGGGKHFRGIVPYNAISDFGGRLGSSTLDSFLRRSVSPGDFSRYAGRLTPFYSQTRTVTTMRPGQMGVVRPPTMRIGGRAADRNALPSLSGKAPSLSQGLSLSQGGMSYGRFGSAPVVQQGTGDAFLGEFGTSIQRMGLSNALLQQVQMRGLAERFLQGELRIEDVDKSGLSTERRKTEVEAEPVSVMVGQELKSVLDGLGVGRQAEPAQMRRGFLTEQELKKAAEPQLSEGLNEQEGSLQLQSKAGTKTDTSENFGQLWDALRKDDKIGARRTYGGFELQEPTRTSDEFLTPRFRGDEYMPAKADAGETAVQKRAELTGFQEPAGVWGPAIYEQIEQQLDDIGKRSDRSSAVSRKRTIEIPEVSYEQQVRVILGSHETFASFSEAKFTQHVKAAEGYLKRGSYYQAADAYTLASVYKPKNPVVCAGKSHALFAAGEYMSSALFLSRALEAYPEYEKKLKAKDEEPKAAKFSVFTLLASSFALIDRDKLESRAADIEQWQQKTDSAELEFLLGYVYYQMGRGERAKEAVRGAHEKMPEAPAVVILKEAIESAQP